MSLKRRETLDLRVTLPPANDWTPFLPDWWIFIGDLSERRKKSGFFQIETLCRVPTRAFFHSGCDGQSVSRICCRFLVRGGNFVKPTTLFPRRKCSNVANLRAGWNQICTSKFAIKRTVFVFAFWRDRIYLFDIFLRIYLFIWYIFLNYDILWKNVFTVRRGVSIGNRCDALVS